MCDEFDESLSRELREVIGHYVAGVGECLLYCGYPISSFTYTGWLDPSLEDAPMDGEGSLYLPGSTIRTLGGAEPGAVSVGLQWTADSGWTIIQEVHLPDARPVFVDRWMGGGLAPSPREVCGLFLTATLDVSRSGSRDRPRYRTPGVDLKQLFAMLAAHTLRHENMRPSPDARLREARNRAALRLVTQDVLAKDDTINVPMRRGELQAISRMLEYSETDAQGHLSEFRTALVDDLRQRASEAGPGAWEVIARYSQAEGKLRRHRRDPPQAPRPPPPPSRTRARHLEWCADRLGPTFAAGLMVHTCPRVIRFRDRIAAVRIAAVPHRRPLVVSGHDQRHARPKTAATCTDPVRARRGSAASPAECSSDLRQRHHPSSGECARRRPLGLAPICMVMPRPSSSAR